MGAEESSILSHLTKPSKSDEEILSMLGITDSKLSAEKREHMVRFLKNSAKSLIHMIKTKSSDPMMDALVKFLELKAEHASDAAESVQTKLDEFSESSSKKDEKLSENEEEPSALASLSDLEAMEKRLSAFATDKMKEVHDEVTKLNKAVEDPKAFMEEEEKAKDKAEDTDFEESGDDADSKDSDDSDSSSEEKKKSKKDKKDKKDKKKKEKKDKKEKKSKDKKKD